MFDFVSKVRFIVFVVSESLALNDPIVADRQEQHSGSELFFFFTRVICRHFFLLRVANSSCFDVYDVSAGYLRCRKRPES